MNQSCSVLRCDALSASAYRARAIVVAAFLFSCSSCCIVDKDGVEHTLIFGFGIVSTKQEEDVTVKDVRAVGLVIDGGLSAGIVQKHQIQFDPTKCDAVYLSVAANLTSLSIKIASGVTVTPEHIYSLLSLEEPQ